MHMKPKEGIFLGYLNCFWCQYYLFILFHMKIVKKNAQFGPQVYGIPRVFIIFNYKYKSQNAPAFIHFSIECVIVIYNMY